MSLISFCFLAYKMEYFCVKCLWVSTSKCWFMCMLLQPREVGRGRGRWGGCEENSQGTREAKQMVSQVSAQQEVCPGAEPGSPRWVGWSSEEHRCWASPHPQLGTVMAQAGLDENRQRDDLHEWRRGSQNWVRDTLEAVSEKVSIHVEGLCEILLAREIVLNWEQKLYYNYVSRVSTLLGWG